MVGYGSLTRARAACFVIHGRRVELLTRLQTPIILTALAEGRILFILKKALLTGRELRIRGLPSILGLGAVHGFNSARTFVAIWSGHPSCQLLQIELLLANELLLRGVCSPFIICWYTKLGPIFVKEVHGSSQD